MKNKFNFIIPAILTVAVSLFYLLGGLYSHDNAVSDLLYQREEALNGNIVIIGYDDKSLTELGRFQDWNRDVWTEAIGILNSGENKPAVIGIDTIFDAAGADVTADERLTRVIAGSDNVVLAGYATFGISIDDNGGGFSVDRNVVTNFTTPLPKFKAHVAHINAALDKDGVLRHSIGSLTMKNGGSVNSFAQECYRLYSGMPEVADNKFQYVAFTGKAGAFYYCGISDFLNGKITPGVFANKIVLLGPYAPGLTDDYTTAIDHSRTMYGVEFQANVINALLKGDLPKSVNNAVQFMILLIVSAMCLYLFLNRKARFSAIVWIGVSALWVILCVALRDVGLLLHPLWLPFAVTVLYVYSVAANYIKVAIKNRRITNTFKKYVAPEVVNELLKRGADTLTESSTKQIAVFFVDIRGFTPLSESLPPEQVVKILNRYLSLVFYAVTKNGGTLDKFIGDAAMAFWGAPLPDDDAVYHAVKTAFDVIKEADVLREELLEKFGREVNFGIGVHCGNAVVGNIGATERMDYTAIGDTVNTAARLEANAPSGCLYISRAVADVLGDRLECTSLGSTVRLKGKKEGFEVLRSEKLN